ncbi:Eco57I restriction-modification methylase domain-containing protein [Helicobacter marmotae]|uniref:site-specific DNA-methyltransferase (adenine-specific) n=1 Tax=Helicobacter marmotae TaxID=152490 RepID=A0A3D8I7L9_9HELI|nr:hypothetical protein [Helicobacter marmotae]RDU60744.1 hypothetical protein CQA63_01890 [Helicobacter marmotae]
MNSQTPTMPNANPNTNTHEALQALHTEAYNEINNEEGWDIVLGNPPYGASLSKEEKSTYKALYPNASSNTAQIFICKAQELLNERGINSFIVPKSLAYVSNWEKIREILLANLVSLIDCSKAFKNANLEMLIYLQNVAKKHKTYGTASFRWHKALALIDKALTCLFGNFPLAVKEKELRLGSKIARNMKQSLADCGEHIWGDVFYKQVVQTPSDFKVLGGKEIQKYTLSSTPKGYVGKDLILSDKAEIKPNSVLLQRIISCAAMGVEQTSICGTIIEDNPAQYRIVNTIHQIVCHQHISNRFILGLLHSKLINWYAYHFIFSKAKMSFQFSGESVKSFPIPKITTSNQHIVDTIIALVEEILRLKANCAVLGAQSGGEESLQNPHTTQLLCHSERSEESLSESLVTHRDSSVVSLPQNDNKSNPQGKITLQGKLVCHSKHCAETSPESPVTPLVCHSEGFMPEESLLSTRDSLTESLERQPLCHSKHCEELLSKTPKSTTSDSCRDSSPLAGVQNDKLGYPQRKLVCHSEGGQSPTEESLYESLVAHRDSSPAMQAQNDNGIESVSNPNSNSSTLPRDENISHTSELEAQIDALVYTLYNLTQDEIAIIESSAQNARKAKSTSHKNTETLE